MSDVVMLDTHVAIALFKGQIGGFSKPVKRHLDNGALRISPTVRFELEVLFEIGRIRENGDTVCGYLADELSVVESPESMREIVRCAQRFAFTRDPFDRLIIAHAELLRVPLITLDQHLLAHFPRAMG
jgi:PIN domain nuclease of toxin-antitoxin system